MKILSFVIGLILCKQAESKGANEFDTYNADECMRVRRSWNSLTKDEQQLYVDALMEIRKNGGGDPFRDEFIAIGSVHEDSYGGENHFGSSYLFWHGYMLWELESRIRNLGGKYSCFAMPYWNFATDEESSDFLTKNQEILGGEGDPDNYYNVNGYSWDYTTQQFWVPAHCDAEGDEYPICSLKRSTKPGSQPSIEFMGEGIIDNPVFADFDRWYRNNVNLPHNFLIDADYLHLPVVTQYDPIWYLFHSMVSYHQAIWTDCNDYDLIKPSDLQDHPEAYVAFCDAPCGAMQLDDKMYYGGSLPDQSWSYIHNNKLTVRDSYHMPRWNVIYDLGNGDGFFTDSGLKDYCKGKLNPEWFMLNGQDLENEQPQNIILDVNGALLQTHGQLTVVTNQLIIALVFVITVGFVAFTSLYCCNDKNTKQVNMKRNPFKTGYGAV